MIFDGLKVWRRFLAARDGIMENSRVRVKDVTVTARPSTNERYVRIRVHFWEIVVIQPGLLHRQDGCSAPKLTSSWKNTRSPAWMPTNSADCIL